MQHHWQVFWSDPDGSAGMVPVTAGSLEEAHRLVLREHPRAKVSAIDADDLHPKWMPSLMLDWLRDWEEHPRAPEARSVGC